MMMQSNMSCRRVAPLTSRARAPTQIRAAAKGFGAKPTVSSAKETCSCGSKVVYRECCEPFHTKKLIPGTAELALRARFSAYTKGDVDYLVETDRRAESPEDQKKRDITAACKVFSYSGLKVLETEAGPSEGVQLIKFQYKSKRLPERQAGNIKYVGKNMSDQATADRNIDGSYKIYTTLEKSKFEKSSDGVWLLTASDVISTTE